MAIRVGSWVDAGPAISGYNAHTMRDLPRHLEQVLRRLREGFEQLYGQRFKGLILFGSHARGEARADSDVDLLLLLEGPVSPLREIKKAEEVQWPLALSEDLVLSLLPVDVDAYANDDEPFLRRARKEGLRIA